MRIPKARGALSETLFAAMTAGSDRFAAAVASSPDSEDDAQIALWALYELHYRGFEDCDEALEWHPDLIRIRGHLEHDFEATLRSRFPGDPGDEPFAEALFDYIARHDGPALSPFVRRHATREQALDLLRMRSIYHLKESDPVDWVVPRLEPVSKAALVELQFDEFGGGDPARLHAHMFARGLEETGLDSAYGAYIDDVPHEILAMNNAMSLFGLHRRLRAAALGHLAAFEATSSLPSRKVAQGLERLGFGDAMIGYYLEHVEADAVHEQLAVRTICGSLVEAEPRLRADVFLGAFTCLDLEERFAVRMLAEWGADA